MASKFNITIQADTRRIDAWVEGKIMTDEKKVYKFAAKVFDEGSEFGIRNGRVSKLFIREDSTTIVSYDRRWDVRPTSEHKEMYRALLKELNQLSPIGVK